jgi:hypothetical protein
VTRTLLAECYDPDTHDSSSHIILLFNFRYPPVPKYPPIAFYSAVRLGDPEQLAKVMDADPYFITQDNGAGAPVHFATTYKQLDMVRSMLRLWLYLSLAYAIALISTFISLNAASSLVE